ncbi:MAG: hypothetical protein ACKOAD_05960, partial [Gammaproteobacteria bacterium]
GGGGRGGRGWVGGGFKLGTEQSAYETLKNEKRKEFAKFVSIDKFYHSVLNREINHPEENFEKLFRIMFKMASKKDFHFPSAELCLRRSAALGDFGIVKFLVENLKDLDLEEKGPESGMSALDFSRKYDHSNIEKYLLEAIKSKIKPNDAFSQGILNHVAEISRQAIFSNQALINRMVSNILGDELPELLDTEKEVVLNKLKI